MATVQGDTMVPQPGAVPGIRDEEDTPRGALRGEGRLSEEETPPPPPTKHEHRGVFVRPIRARFPPPPNTHTGLQRQNMQLDCVRCVHVCVWETGGREEGEKLGGGGRILV